MRSFVFVIILLIGTVAVVPDVSRWPLRLAVSEFLSLEEVANAVWSNAQPKNETDGIARGRRPPDGTPPLAHRHAGDQLQQGIGDRAAQNSRQSSSRARHETARRKSPNNGHQPIAKVHSIGNYSDPAGGRSGTSTSDNRVSDSPFDMVRISSARPSVFAGTTKPNVQVTVLAGKRVIGVTESDREGRWVLVTDRKIKSPNAQFGVKFAPKVSSAFASRSTFSAVLSNRERKQSVSEVKTRQLASLKRLVAEAAESGRQNAIAAIDEALDVQSRGGAKHSADRNSERSADRSVEGPGPGASMPIPIQFAFRQAEFTPSGQEAANLLADYLIAKKFKRAILTGHADERGSEKLNESLSRDRLYAVRRHLRERGFKGTLILLPRGEAEPFSGIERSLYTDVELYKLDRRVELKLE